VSVGILTRIRKIPGSNIGGGMDIAGDDQAVALEMKVLQ
jgi:hypothetical protein